MRDAIDNRNIALLDQIWNDLPPDLKEFAMRPRDYSERHLNFVLSAMRKAGDEALLDQVTVRLERSFGSTRDVRANATLAIPDQQP